jgi:hypothetical protein
MCRPIRTWNRGRLTRLGDTSEDYAHPLWRQHVHKESARNTGSPIA